MATRSEVRRDAILAAALACFTETGYEAASIACICRGAEASVGSVYHHFGGKEGVAAALYLEGIRRYQHGLIEILTSEPGPRPGITRVVEYHIEWVRSHPDWARFLFRAAPLGAVERASITQRNAVLLESLDDWIERHAAEGKMVGLEPGVFLAITIGPCHELVRRWLGGDATIDLVRLAPELAAAACRAAGVSDKKGEPDAARVR